MGRTVLIDADILAYQIASTQEEVFTFGDQEVYHADLEKGLKEVENHIAWIIDHVDADGAALFLTGPENFRKEVLPTYKENRKDTRRPTLLPGIREWMLENTRCFMEQTLEGDDLIGIHATMPHKGERIIYSADKDLKTVPGLHWCPEDGEVKEIEEVSADRSFLLQVITGDAVDNYQGCPGAGPVAAHQLLYGNMKWVKSTRPFKSGPRKGQDKVTWSLAPLEGDDNWWTSVVSAYEKAGLTETDAIIQARCARILRHGEYDFEKGKVKLWTPS